MNPAVLRVSELTEPATRYPLQFGEDTGPPDAVTGTPNRRGSRAGEGALSESPFPSRIDQTAAARASPPAGTPVYEPTYRYSSLRIRVPEVT